MSLHLITPPATEPVTLVEAKVHLEVDYDDHDELITNIIVAARRKLEKKTHRSFVEQTLELRFNGFNDKIELPAPPLLSVTSVKYTDYAGDTQTVDATTYHVIDMAGDVSFIEPVAGWPTDASTRSNSVQVQYVAGYSSLPYDLRQGILWIVGHLYENRESVSLTPTRQEFQEVPDSVDAIIELYIVATL